MLLFLSFRHNTSINITYQNFSSEIKKKLVKCIFSLFDGFYFSFVGIKRKSVTRKIQNPILHVNRLWKSLEKIFSIKPYQESLFRGMFWRLEEPVFDFHLTIMLSNFKSPYRHFIPMKQDALTFNVILMYLQGQTSQNSTPVKLCKWSIETRKLFQDDDIPCIYIYMLLL